MKKRISIFRNSPVQAEKEVVLLCTYILPSKCEEKKGEDVKKVLSCRKFETQPFAQEIFHKE